MIPKGLILAAAAYAQLDENFEGPDGSERYFFTTTIGTGATTTTVRAPTGDAEYCWKCDEMTFNQCASDGHYEECTLGDQDCCFIEIRESQQKLQQLCTGCKDNTACSALMAYNFAPGGGHLNDQCRPDYQHQRRHMRNGPQQSVCRQCIRTCTPSIFNGAYCFGSFPDGSQTPVEFLVPFDASSAQYPGMTQPDTLVFGIPTHALIDGHASMDAAIVTKITNFTFRNVYFANPGDGKAYAGTADAIKKLDEMTYWSIRGASEAWWSFSAKIVQDSYNSMSLAGCTSNGASDATVEYSGCTPFGAF